MLHGELPNQEHLADFQSILVESTELAPAISEFMGRIPLHVPAMDALRTGISALGNFDPQLEEEGPNACIQKTLRLVVQIPILIATRFRQSQGLPLVEPKRSVMSLVPLTGLPPGTMGLSSQLLPPSCEI